MVTQHTLKSNGSAQTAMLKKFADRKSTRLNSSHLVISYAVFCLKKKNVVKRSEEHTSELQSPCNLVSRLLLEKKKPQTSVTPLEITIHTLEYTHWLHTVGITNAR